jgi:hypothetical protein
MTDRPVFATMLSGGSPNSLGRTLEVVEHILADSSLVEQLYQCYFDDDPVVRLRVSNAMKRICAEHPDWLVPYIDRFLSEISGIDQASTQWTLAQLFLALQDRLTAAQRAAAVDVMKRNLTTSNDWIVLNQTMQTLGKWAKADTDLQGWLLPHVQRLKDDSRKSVASSAAKLYKSLLKSAP